MWDVGCRVWDAECVSTLSEGCAGLEGWGRGVGAAGSSLWREGGGSGPRFSLCQFTLVRNARENSKFKLNFLWLMTICLSREKDHILLSSFLNGRHLNI